MLLAFRYLRRDMRRGGKYMPVSNYSRSVINARADVCRPASEGRTSVDAPPATPPINEDPYKLPPIRDDRLPPIRDILGEDFGRRDA